MLAFIGMPGPLEMLIVAFVMLLLFGNRLPGVMRSLGRGVVEFKHGLHGVEDDDDDEPEPPKKSKRADKISAE
ncbi:MAG: twin-arginine translocase TatA/TatE family subunit [Pirellulaceae bacterium]|jgi:sec-independent protein translocase protein TatA|nr:twin-arginine translocase TatA/TatE family subunit [Pirellulaceae bacterium]